MRLVSTVLVGVLCTFPLLARAATGGAPLAISHSGYLLSATDTPLTATVTLGFGVFGATTGGVAEWTGACAGVAVQGGFYEVRLGGPGCAGTGGVGDAVLDTSDLPPGADRWLELTVAGTVMEPRLALSVAPVAARAHDADLLAGHAAGDFALADHDHAAADVTGLATIATTGSWNDLADRPSTFPPATHAHTAGQVSGLATIATTGAWANLTGTPSTFPPSAHTHTAAEVTGLATALAGATVPGSLAATTFQGNLVGNVTGLVKLGTTTTCGTGDGGTLRWTGTALEVCNGTTWEGIGAARVPVSVVFTSTGAEQQFLVPTGVTSIQVKAWGAGGGGTNNSNNDGLGGAGGYAGGTVPVVPGETLKIVVGKGGSTGGTGASAYGGGGTAGGQNNGGGGGLAGVFRTSVSQANALVVAGAGGGGGSYANSGVALGHGGAGGGTSGLDGQGASPAWGKGASASAGGVGGTTVACPGCANGETGAALRGGNWGSGSGSAGGGSGYWGGGGGAHYGGIQGGSAGGGSGFLGPTVTSRVLEAGSGATPPRTSEAGYAGSAGVGGNRSAGGDGLVVIIY